jgi:diguanylate cyclase (GGDEF)-like protein/PAS domain S-box-containing protein
MIASREGALVLLVDDGPVDRAIAANTLRQAGFRVIETQSGEEALECFAAEPVEAVLLDVVMQGLDGYAVCERLRALPRGRWLPIIMLTGLKDTESIELAYRSGATDFIMKPINWALLAHRVRYSLRASEATQTAVQSREKLARAQHLARMGSWEWLPAEDRMTCSEELARILGHESAAALGSDSSVFLAHAKADDFARVAEARRNIAASGGQYRITFAIRRADGSERTVFEQAVAIRDEGGRVARVEGITQDISDRVEADRIIHQLAFFDGLTGLANRRSFHEKAHGALETATRLGRRCAAIGVGLDRFKAVNDALGDEAGDALLQQIGQRLLACSSFRLPSADWEGEPPRAFVARTGGDTFGLLLEDVRGDDEAIAFAANALESLAQPVTIQGRELVLTASLGIATFPGHGADADELIRHAEQAMYVAKASGRGAYRLFDEAMSVAASAKLELETRLRRAVERSELRLCFQPKVDASTGRMCGAEALVRWLHPERGILQPADFIPLAEESGLIRPIDDWVMDLALGLMQRWGAKGFPPIPVAINLSGPRFSQGDLASRLSGLAARAGIPSGRITLEVTESLLMPDVDGAIVRLNELRESGFAISLDDFGTGYSSLSHLKRFPIDELKIDRSFMADVSRRTQDRALVAGIIALSRQLGLRVVAEGVETYAQSAFLLWHGCSIQQGFLHAAPMEVAQFEALLAQGDALVFTRTGSPESPAAAAPGS